MSGKSVFYLGTILFSFSKEKKLFLWSSWTAVPDYLLYKEKQGVVLYIH